MNRTTALLIATLLTSMCGIVYELVLGALASYLLGDSVTQFSLIIGIYLSSMGVGAYLAKHIHKNLVDAFIKTELLVALIGGVSAGLLFLVFEEAYSFRSILFLLVFLIGALVGIEIPLLMRILKDRLDFSDLVSRVLSFDYIGALFASILFPLVLAPELGLIRTAFMFGIINAFVAVWMLLLLENEIRYRLVLKTASALVMAVLIAGFAAADKIVSVAEASMYPHEIAYSRNSAYQRIVLTKAGSATRLYLNSHLQFDSRDEYRYHEALVIPGIVNVPSPKRVLVLGGGDGMALREILKVPSVESATMVDLDPEITDLFTKTPFLAELNQHSLSSPKLSLINADAYNWLREHPESLFDFIVIDLPDPTNYSIGKLYSVSFYEEIKKHLHPDGMFVVQSTSPLLAKKSFWCVERTIRDAGLSTAPYHTHVPSFGEWGFILAGHSPPLIEHKTLPGARYLSPEVYPSLFQFPPDMAQVPVEANRLTNQILVRYYEDEWSQYVP